MTPLTASLLILAVACIFAAVRWLLVSCGSYDPTSVESRLK